MEDRDEFFGCSCHDLSHISCFSYFGPYKGDPAEMYLNILLGFYKGFFKRIKSALKYIFHGKNEECDFDYIILRTEDMDRLILFSESCFSCKSDYVDGCFVIEEPNGKNWKYASDRKIVLIDCTEENVIEFFLDRFDFEDKYFEELTIRSYLKEEKNIFKRLYRGIKYVFGYKSRCGTHCCSDISNSNMANIKTLANIAKKSYEEFSKKN